MANEKKEQQLQMTGQEVQQAIQNAPALQTPGSMTNPNGYNAITPLNTEQTVPKSSAWRNVQETGKAKTDYEALKAAMPGAYQGTYTQPLQQTMNNLLGQRNYKYDVNTDALYQQIKDNYIRQGRQAMMDTQGASAALTGGYGNSYGALAGQQAYQESLGNLANQIPQLYQLAYQRYLGNENSQRQNLAALQQLEDTDYQRYQADAQQYEQKLAQAYAKYQAASSGGGGGAEKKLSYNQYKQYVADALDWADSTGGDVSEFVQQGVRLGVIPQEAGSAVINAANVYVNAQQTQARQQDNQETLNRLRTLGLLNDQ